MPTTMSRPLVLSLWLAASSCVTAQPTNDDCTSPLTFTSVPFSAVVNTADATSDFNSTTCNVPATHVGVWLEYGGNDKIVEVQISSATFDNRLTVFEGTDCSDLACLFSNDGYRFASALSWAALSSKTYQLLVSGEITGTANIDITEIERPLNDSCETAIEIPSIPFSLSGDSSGAFTDFTATTCSVSTDDRGVWYKFSPSEDKILQLQVTDATFNNRLVVFAGTCELLSCFASNDGYSTGSYLSWAGTASTEYTVLVTGVNGFNDVGTFTLSVSDLERPVHDSCTNAIELPSIPFSISGDSSGAYTDFSVSTCSVGPENRGVWYKFRPSEDKILQLQVTDATFDNRLVVFTGACNLFSCFANNNGYSTGSYLSWAGTANTEYTVLVTGVNGFNDVGTFTLSVSDLERPLNDSCENAIELPSIPFSISGDSSGAYTDFSVSTCSVGPENRGVWYKFRPSKDKILELQVASATYDNRLVVFTGACNLFSCFANNNGYSTGSFLSWAGTANTEYTVLVTGVNGFNDVGTFTLSVSELDRPSNDKCETATLVAKTSFSALSDTSGAFTDFNLKTCSVNENVRGIWYTFIGEDGMVDITITNAVFNVNLVAFSGECTLLACIGNNDGYSSSASLSLSTVDGTKYSILVTGVSDFAQVGTFEITMEGDIATTVAPAPTGVPTPGPVSTPVVIPTIRAPTISPQTQLDLQPTGFPTQKPVSAPVGSPSSPAPDPLPTLVKTAGPVPAAETSTDAPTSLPTAPENKVSMLSMEENTSVTIEPPPSTTSVVMEDFPRNGSVGIGTDNSITYTSVKDFVGNDVFSARYCDALDQCATVDFEVTVFASKSSSGATKGLYGLAGLAIIPVIALLLVLFLKRRGNKGKANPGLPMQEVDPAVSVTDHPLAEQLQNKDQARTHIMEHPSAAVAAPANDAPMVSAVLLSTSEENL